eukprot:3780321-Pleurochrysis_carterae.AAC.1
MEREASFVLDGKRAPASASSHPERLATFVPSGNGTRDQNEADFARLVVANGGCTDGFEMPSGVA